MAEDLIVQQGTKTEQYQALLPQIAAIIEGETDTVANLANIAAALKEQFGWFWVGFYLVKDDELVVGPFQGPVACTRIRKGRGVCGASWERAATSLCVHRSTLKYRLQRIREISAHDLADPETNFNLHLATRAWQTLHTLHTGER